MKRILFSVILFFIFSVANAQKILSPDEFLGYKLGDHFTPHHRVVAYFEHLSKNSTNIQLQTYGSSYERRPLIIAKISSVNNLQNLEEIRTNNLKITGLMAGSPTSNQKPIVWLNYNIHGNEAVSTESSMQTAYELLTKPDYSAWLDKTVVIIEPCVNPDGRDRYVGWYLQMQNAQIDINPNAIEHQEPNPNGRFNHYLYDLNRDWAWQSQKESQERMKLYHEYMPQIHADFHEMEEDQPYYFAPAAQPYHAELTTFQRDFQQTIGKNHAKYFDKNGWLYFTKETFDLLYPSYGDTYPMYNGAIGMTYEQGGGGDAGVAVRLENGDTLTLAKRIEHSHIVGLSTIEVAVVNQEKLMQEYKNFFEKNNNNPSGEYKTYIIKGENNPKKIEDLLSFLDRQQIRYGYASNLAKGLKVYNYQTQASENVNLAENDIVINTYQPKSVLIKVLFNPKTILVDSMTYDVTAWALPYAFNLKAYASATKIDYSDKKVSFPTKVLPENTQVYAYLSEWKSMSDAKFLTQLLKANVKVRFAEKPFSLDNQNYAEGTLIITKLENEDLPNFDQIVRQIADKNKQNLTIANTGFVEKGTDLGSKHMNFLKKPKIAIIGGENVIPTEFGALWHFLDRQLEYPSTILNGRNLDMLDLDQFNVLLIPDCFYNFVGQTEKLTNWVQKGGKLILVGRANNVFGTLNDFALRTEKEDELDGKEDPKKKKKPAELIKKYANREREALSEEMEGSIYKVRLDNTHPLGFGYEEEYFSLRRNSTAFNLLEEGWNVGTIGEKGYIDGFVGYKIKEKLKNTLTFGTNRLGKGSVVYLIDNPVYRSSWQGGRLLFCNALFFVGQ
ncbi:MAG: zinc carboxypeptidase [Bacteroidetes bacterium]|nr:MAG: zinc carboxypeptidase [Bacteroidota bacterium]